MMFFIRFWSYLTKKAFKFTWPKKNSFDFWECEIGRYIFKKFLLLILTIWGRFIDLDSDFSDPDPNFLTIRIRTQEKKSDPDPDKRTRIRNTAQTNLPDGFESDCGCPLSLTYQNTWQQSRAIQRGRWEGRSRCRPPRWQNWASRCSSADQSWRCKVERGWPGRNLNNKCVPKVSQSSVSSIKKD